MKTTPDSWRRTKWRSAVRVLTGEQIFINVGTRALVPPIPGLKDVPHLTNSSMMDIDLLPPHLIVLGGSYVGLEFAQAYRRFGSEVTVIELAPRLIAREDEDVSRAVAEFLQEDFQRGLLTGQQWIVDNSQTLQVAEDQLVHYLLPFFLKG